MRKLSRALTLVPILSVFALGLAGCEVLLFGLEQAQGELRDREINRRFDRLEEHLGMNNVPDEDKATPASVEAAFPAASFPRASCGDVLPSDKSVYPLSYYPVFIENTADNLRLARENFCADAILKKDERTGQQVIQVASFYTERASEFLRLMEDNFGSAELGQERVIDAP